MKYLLRNKLPYWLCYITAFATGMKMLREPDIWWQLLSGRWMLEHGQVTRTDVFSYTMAGHPWVNVKWLYEIGIALLEKLTGPLGVLLLQSTVNVAIVYLLFRSMKQMGAYMQKPISKFFSAFAVIFFLAVVEYRMAGRPEMISHLMCALFLFILLRNPKLEFKNVFWLIPLQCLWANMHEGYPVGLVMTGTFIAGNLLAYFVNKDKACLQQSARALIIFSAAILVLLINPNGIQLWKQPFEIYRQVGANKYTTELFAFYQPEYWTIQAKLHVALFALVVIFWLSKLWKAKKNNTITAFLSPLIASYLLLIVLFGYLALTANRNIPFIQIILFPSAPFAIAWLLSIFKINNFGIYKGLQRQTLLLSSAIVIAFFLLIVSNTWYKYTKLPNKYGLHITMLRNPTGAAKFIRDNHVQGPAFADYFVSSYLLWDLYPQFKSYIDLRDLDVFPGSFFDQYFELYPHPEKFKSLDSQYNFNYAVFSTSQLLELQQQLYWLKGYYFMYADPVSSVFLKENETNKALIANAAIQKPFSWPEAQEAPAWAAFLNKLFNPFAQLPADDEDPLHAPVRAASYYFSLRDYPQAISQVLPKLHTMEEDKGAYLVLANSYAEYANITKDPILKQKRMDSSSMYIERVRELEGK